MDYLYSDNLMDELIALDKEKEELTIPIEEWSNFERWEMLSEFSEEMSYHPNWPNNILFINEDVWEEYVQDMAEEQLGKIPFWIDVNWETTAEGVRIDYKYTVFDGESYLYRS